MEEDLHPPSRRILRGLSKIQHEFRVGSLPPKLELIFLEAVAGETSLHQGHPIAQDTDQLKIFPKGGFSTAAQNQDTGSGGQLPSTKLKAETKKRFLDSEKLLELKGRRTQEEGR